MKNRFCYFGLEDRQTDVLNTSSQIASSWQNVMKANVCPVDQVSKESDSKHGNDQDHAIGDQSLPNLATLRDMRKGKHAAAADDDDDDSN